MPTFQPSALPAGAYRVSNKNHDYWIVDADGNIIGQTGANGQDTFFASYQTDSNGNVVGLLGPGGEEIQIFPTNRSILTIGGDHPYAQWWGSNGEDGMAAMYRDLKIDPYLAICSDESLEGTSGVGATLNKSNMLTDAQARNLQERGVEFVGHGARHIHFWDLVNTGIRVYYTGGEATPTVNITTTQLTTNTAVTGATNFLFATYPTIAELQTAINALAGWNCLLATELLGTEPSAALLPLNAARSVIDAGGSDTTDSNQRFALSGGILLRYTGRVYKRMQVSCNDGSNFISIYGDGSRLFITSTSATIISIVNAINALNIAGFSAFTMDNGYNAVTLAGSTALNPGQKLRETYCFGDELASSLPRVTQLKDIDFRGTRICGGLGFGYTMQRLIESTIERATAQGITLNSWAQPGGRVFPWHLNGIADKHVHWRGNRSWTEANAGLPPHAMPMNNLSKFTGHWTAVKAITEEYIKGVIDALGDSDGWHVDILNHLCTPTPGDPSPYTGLNQHPGSLYTSSADQDEGPFYRELVYAAAARDAGRIDILPPTRAEYERVRRRGPSNLIFNPKFRTGRSDNTLPDGAPGWQLSAVGADWSAVTVDNFVLKYVTNGALGASKLPVNCNVFLEPGETYTIGAILDLSAWPTAGTMRFGLYPMDMGLGDAFDSALAAQQSVGSGAWYGGFRDVAEFCFTVPPVKKPSGSYIRGIAGPFSFTAGDSITLNLDNRGATAAIVLTGLTTAKTVAAAINTAVAADAIYASLAQYHNCAYADNNRLVIETPNLNSFPQDGGSLTQVANSAGTPLVTLFGAGITAVRASASLEPNKDSSVLGYRLAMLPSSTVATSTFTVTAPFCRKQEL